MHPGELGVLMSLNTVLPGIVKRAGLTANTRGWGLLATLRLRTTSEAASS